MEAQTPRKQRQSFSVSNPATILTIRTPLSTLQNLRSRADRDGKSISMVINDAFDAYLGLEQDGKSA